MIPEFLYTPHHALTSSESEHSKIQCDAASPAKASWNGYNLFTTPPVMIFSRENESVHFNGELEFTEQEKRTACILDNSNPFIRLFGLKNEEHLARAIADIDLEESAYFSRETLSKEKNTFHFDDRTSCYKTKFSPEQLKELPLAQALSSLAAKINTEISLNISRHFHFKPITGNLPPHEDPPICKWEDLPDADGKQKNPIAYNCDYLLTNVRSVTDSTLEADHLCVYIAAKGLGNTNTGHSIIANPVLTDKLITFFSSICSKKPIALRICEIDNKAGAGYAINQNTEYTIDIEEIPGIPASFQAICRNNENPRQSLFQRKLENLEVNSKDIISRFKDSNKTKPIIFKVLHGYEISPAKASNPTEVKRSITNEEKPVMRREILIGRLSVIPREEDLPAFYEKKSTEYSLGSKLQT